MRVDTLRELGAETLVAMRAEPVQLLPLTLPEIGPDATTREPLEAHFSDPSCAGCHAPMDGIGFTFESLDWLGRYRDEEHGEPIDDASTFLLDGADVTVKGLVELAAALADSGTAPTCTRTRCRCCGPRRSSLSRRSSAASTPTSSRPRRTPAGAAPVGVDSQTAIDRQSDLMAAALGCGLSRVASMQVRIADNDNTLYPWLDLTEGGHHTMSHDSSAGSQATLAGLYRWYAERFAYLLDRLSATPDADGRSVLDNTLVIWGSELGRAWDHDISNVPFVFAGATDMLRGGRYLSGSPIVHGRVLVSACHAMGLVDVEQYGSLDTGSGPLPGLFL